MPMAPTLVRAPFHRDGWVYEEKVDGWRMLAYKDGDRVRLVSRNGRDHTRRFADLDAAVAALREPDSEAEIMLRDTTSHGGVPMHVHNLYCDANGESHFRDIEIELSESRVSGLLSKPQPVSPLIFRGSAECFMISPQSSGGWRHWRRHPPREETAPPA